MDEELAGGEECMRQLLRSLDEQGACRSELRMSLAEKVVASFTSVRFLLNSEESWSAEPPPPPAAVTESPRSTCSSPTGEIHDKNSGKIFGDRERREVRKKRWVSLIFISFASDSLTRTPYFLTGIPFRQSPFQCLHSAILVSSIFPPFCFTPHFHYFFNCLITLKKNRISKFQQ